MSDQGATIIACIVEGPGEVQALPILLRRIAAEVDPGTYLWMPRPYRINRSSLLRPEALERVVRIQGDRVSRTGGVLILIDADDDCPAQLAPRLLTSLDISRVVRSGTGLCWSLCSADSVSCCRHGALAHVGDVLSQPGRTRIMHGPVL